MQKFIYEVPKGIRFMTELDNIFSIPDYPCIIDKQLTGCGFTHWMINNKENIVLCSPRKMLLENKEQQNSHVLYIRNECDKESNYEKDISTFERIGLDEIDNVEYEKIQHLKMKQQIRDYIYNCNSQSKPSKILVTYDSFRIVKEVLQDYNLVNNFRFVVDEFQSIFVDSRFKSTTELNFVGQLQNIQKVCFVSATPMIEEYLEQLEEFKDLSYIRLDWEKQDPMRVMKPALDVKSISGKSISGVAKIIIQSYLDGNFEKTVIKDPNGNLVEIESKECVIYVNSVKNILDIIAGSKLSPEQVNILCSNTKQNQAKINKRLNRLKLGKYLIGSIPIEGDDHKMFTFCTRTVYLGADFYSKCARSFIFSDANIDCLAVDITLDLPQILGRQRLEDNPWKNKGSLYVKLLNKDKIKCKEEFDKFVAEKIKITNTLMDVYGRSISNDEELALIMKFEDSVKSTNYKRDYIAVDRHRGSFPIPIPNKLVMLSEKRAFDIQQTDYGDRFRLFNSLGSQVTLINNVTQFFIEFNEDGQFVKKMKLLCESDFKGEELDYILKQLPSEFSKYYYTLGPEKIKARAFNRSYLEKDYSKLMFSSSSLVDDIYLKFKEGDRLSTLEVIDSLLPIYEKHNNPNRPKGTDIKEYFETKETKITLQDKTLARGFKLIKRLK